MLGILPAVIMTLTLTGYIVTAQLENLNQAFLQRGNAIAHEAAAISIYGIFSNDTEVLRSSLKPVLKRADLVSISVVNQMGGVLAHIDSPAHRKAKGDAGYESAIASFSAPVYSQINLDPAEPGNRPVLAQVEITLSDSELRAGQRRIIRNSLFLLLAGLVITAGIALALSQRVIQPLSRLTRSVIRMKYGDFSVRVPEKSKGELRSLEEGFNAMADELSNSREILQHQIEQATSDLTQTMEALEIQNVELDLARKRALKASKVKSEFLANISHEIRTPMSGVIGFTKLLLKTRLTAEQRDLANTVEKSASGLLDIINNILDYSKLEYGGLDPEYAPFDISDCFEEPVVLLAPAAHEKQLELILLIYSDVPRQLIGDETRIRQILVNLIGNAIKFTHQGEIAIRVMLEEETESDCLLSFSVTDTGIGISPQVQEKLFTSFHQGSSSTSRLYGGTGLGLSICRKLAESMGGQISLKSEQQQGSSFKVTIKLTKVPIPQSKPANLPFSGKQGLLLDNHQLSRLSLKHALRALGMEIKEQSLEQGSGEITNKPDLILLGFTGHEIANGQLQSPIDAVRQQSESPIIVLLSSSENENLIQVQQMGVTRCLSKPLIHSALQRAIEETLSGENSEHGFGPLVPTPRFHGRRFLVADDSPVNQRLISTLLTETGAEVMEANNGKEAAALAGATNFDLILMDIHMPVLDGVKAAELIRSREGGERHTPIVALTADVVPEHRDQAFSAGIDDYLIKPVDETQLWQAIERQLAAKTLGQQTMIAHAAVVTTVCTQSETLPSRDLAAALKTAGGRDDLAQELFQRFLAELPGEMQTMRRQLEHREWTRLRESSHRMHGTTAVCGVPALNNLVGKIEQAAVRQATDETTHLLQAAEVEANRLIDNEPQIIPADTGPARITS